MLNPAPVRNPNYMFLPPIISGAVLKGLNSVISLDDIPEWCCATPFMTIFATGLIATTELQRLNGSISREELVVTRIITGVACVAAVAVDVTALYNSIQNT